MTDESSAESHIDNSVAEGDDSVAAQLGDATKDKNTSVVSEDDSGAVEVNPEPETTIITREKVDKKPVTGDDPDDVPLDGVALVRQEAQQGAIISDDPTAAAVKNRPSYDEEDASYYRFTDPEEDNDGAYVTKKAVRDGSRSSATKSTEPVYSGYTAYDTEPEKTKRGTIDLGLLILRLAVAGILIFQSLQWLMHLWGGSSVGALADHLQEVTVGFKPSVASVLAWFFVIAITLAGIALLIGLFTPLSAALALLVELELLLVTIVSNGRIGLLEPQTSASSTQGTIFFLAALSALILTGPGLYSIDFSRRWARRPFFGSILLLVLAVGGAIAIWVLFNGHDPFSALHTHPPVIATAN